MKRFYTLALASLAAIASFGQNNSAINEYRSKPRPVSSQDLTQQHPSQNGESQNRGSAFFCEDFEFGFSGNSGMGAWTYDDTGGNSIWMEATNNSPAGQFSSNIPALDSPTENNGWVIFDCDLYNADLSAVEDVTGTLTTPEMDMSGLETVILDYYHYFRYCCFSPSPLTVEVSIDGGNNWSVFDGQGDFIPSANTLSTNPMHTILDISCIAAGQSSVYIRFGYNTAGETGYSHYFWGIDDVCIYENLNANDLVVAQVTNGDIFNLWEYRVTPLEQAPVESDGGLYAGVIYRNNGYVDQTNTVITVDILDETMNVLATVVSDPFTVLSAANSPECPAPKYDTSWFYTNWTPIAYGNYYVRSTISSPDFTDAEPDDNVGLHSFEITAYEYGHDDADLLDIQVGPTDAETAGFFNPCGWGSFYTFPNPGSTAYGLTALFGTNSTENTYMEALLIEIPSGGTLNTNGEEVGYASFDITQEWIDQDFPVYFPYEDAYDIDEELTYFCAVKNPDESEQELWVSAWGDSDNDNSTGSFDQTGDGDFVWFTSRTFTPAVRLILADGVNVEELKTDLGIESFQVYPNPAVTNANIQFTMNQPHVIAYEIRNIEGKLIEFKNIGKFGVGTNNIAIDVTNYTAGNYMVNLVLDGKSLISTQMSVVKN